MKCCHCNRQIDDNARFCTFCGASQSASGKPESVCTRCGRRAEQTGRFCTHCGGPMVAGQGGTGKKRKSRVGVWIALVCLLSLLVGVGFVLQVKVFGPNRMLREIAAADEMIISAVAPYADEHGEVPEEAQEEAATAVYNMARQGVASGKFAYARRQGNTVIIGLKGGGNYVYLPPEPIGGSVQAPPAPRPESPSEPRPESPSAPQPESPSEPRPESPSAPQPESPNEPRPESPSEPQPAPPYEPQQEPRPAIPGAGGEIVSVQPFCAESRASHPREWEYPDLAARRIVDALHAYVFFDNGSASDDNRDDREVTLRFLKTLSSYSVVIWHGHGGYDEELGSFLATTIPYEKQYWNDMIRGRIMVCSGGTVCVTGAFFDMYLEGNINPETVVYLGACDSGKDARLANAFLRKGFDCVLANSDTVSRTYNLQMELRFFSGMSAENGTFFTSGEALSYARSLCGSADPYSKQRAMVRLFGSEDVCFARSAPTPTETPRPTDPPAATEKPAGKVEVDEKALTTLASICSILEPFPDANDLTKQQRVSILHSGLWMDGFAMFGSKYQDAAYSGEDTRIPAAEADRYVRQVLGVGIPDPEADYSDDWWEVYCYDGAYDVYMSDYNVFPVLLSTEQLGNGRLQASFALLAFDEMEEDVEIGSPDMIMTVEQSDGYWGYVVSSLDRNQRRY